MVSEIRLYVKLITPGETVKENLYTAKAPAAAFVARGDAREAPAIPIATLGRVPPSFQVWIIDFDACQKE